MSVGGSSMKCEKCEKEHDGSYGSGRFCSSSCARSRTFSAKTNKLKSEKGRKAWKTRDKSKLRNYKFTEADRARAATVATEKFNKRVAKASQTGDYEIIGRQSRRLLLLEEANFSCESCGRSSWLGKPIWLEIHHIDDNNDNNLRENLMVVCLNCHSALDDNYRFLGRVSKK
jgi:hypothetical protein